MLPAAERLVIGLNPPFGKNGSLANKFVEHAARTFAPRMLVLIVPPATLVRTCSCFAPAASTKRPTFMTIPQQSKMQQGACCIAGCVLAGGCHALCNQR